jgi:hypothetical protein
VKIVWWKTQFTEENAMQQFIDKYASQIQGALTGFDRLVFRGLLRRLNFGWWDVNVRSFVSTGMEQYLLQNKILFKDYYQHVKTLSQRLRDSSVKPFEDQGLPIMFERSPTVDKEELAREVARKREINSGLVCAITTAEMCPTYEHRGTHIVRRERPCGVVYQYQIHPAVGWMYARIQTWFPFSIQVGVNGREWLARQMDKEGLKYRQQGNCFVWIEDYGQAQKLLSRQLEMNWAELLNGFAGQLNPLHEGIFEHYPADYYWMVHQSEWATDVIFREAGFLKRLMPLLVRHGMLSFACPDVMRYFGKRVTQSGDIRSDFQGTLEIDFKRRQEGERVKYRMNGNSAKFYDKAYSEIGSVLRGAETTINAVQDFRAYRAKEGGSEEDLQWRPMRKGIADLHRRAEVSQKTNERLLNALASVDDSRSVEELTAEIQKPTKWGDRRVRGLRPWAEDKELITAINHGEFLINGLRNRDLQKLLYTAEAQLPAERRRRSAAISRKLRLLRAHGLIQKVPRTHRYHVTDAGRVILVTVLTTVKTTLNQLNQVRKAA